MKAALSLFGVLAFASFAAFAQQPFQIDHFKCYYPSQASDVTPAQVLLQDQFGTNPAVIGKIARLCNPTVKYHNGTVTDIVKPDDHLVLHATSVQPLVTRRVKIRNQFGDQTLTTQDARFLAVPTQKDPHAPPQDINHFSCYVAGGPAVNAQVGLKDQFFASKHKVMTPYLFCNPVQKTHNGIVTPITNPDDHLTCYTMNRVAYARDVGLHNQFGNFQIHTAYADSICVPTKKLGWQVVN